MNNIDMEIENRQSLEEIDLHQIITILVRWKWLLALATLLAVLVSGVMSYFILPPVYEAQTTLLVVQGEKQKVTRNETDDLESLIGSISRLPEMTIRTYIEQIKNPVLLSNVITKLDLAKDGYSIEALSGMITAVAIKDTNLIDVRVRNTDGQLARSIAAALTELFLDVISQNTQAQMSKSVKFLQDQADAVQVELSAERDKLRQLESGPRNMDYLEKERTSVMENLMAYKTQYREAEINQQQLEAGMTGLEANLSETAALVGDEPNPAYLSLRERIAEKRLALAENTARMTALSGQIRSLEIQLSSLQSEISTKKGEIQVIERKAAELEKTGSLLSEKITQTQITSSVNLGETSLQIISPATLKANPVKPNKKMNITIAGVLGLMMSVALAFVLELLDNKIRSREDVEKHLGLAVIGVIPKFNGKN